MPAPMSPAERIGISHHRRVEKDWPLTIREKVILLYLSRGLRSKQIAVEMCYSLHTIKLGIRSILKKMGVRTQAEAVAVALRQGIIE